MLEGLTVGSVVAGVIAAVMLAGAAYIYKLITSLFAQLDDKLIEEISSSDDEFELYLFEAQVRAFKDTYIAVAMTLGAFAIFTVSLWSNFVPLLLEFPDEVFVSVGIFGAFAIMMIGYFLICQKHTAILRAIKSFHRNRKSKPNAH